MAVSGVDNFSSLAQRLLDFYFPREEDENDDCGKFTRILQTGHIINFIYLAPIAAKDDPVLHTVQTIGALSNNVARRVYRTVSRQIKVLKKDDLHEYVASLIAVLRLTQYLNFLNDKVQQVVEYKNTASTKTKKDA